MVRGLVCGLMSGLVRLLLLLLGVGGRVGGRARVWRGVARRRRGEGRAHRRTGLEAAILDGGDERLGSGLDGLAVTLGS